MKQPSYKKMPTALKKYWQRQDWSVGKIGFAYGTVFGGVIVGIAWLISLL